MAKAILILPEMPDDCLECRLCFVKDRAMYCLAFLPERVIPYRNDIAFRPEFCPLRSMPENRDFGFWSDGYDNGWNAALRAIGGNEE